MKKDFIIKESLENIDISRYMPIVIEWATNILLAIVILVIGIWIASRVYNLVLGISKKHNKLDDTLFRFLGSVARYIVLAFVFIAVLNRFGVQTALIVALLGAAGLAVALALQGAMSNLAVDMHFGIAYGESTDAARKVIDEVLANHPHILKDPEPFVEVGTLNDSSVDFLVRPFCEGAHYFNVLYSVPEQIKKALDANNIEIPSLTARSLLLTKTHPKCHCVFKKFPCCRMALCF